MTYSDEMLMVARGFQKSRIILTASELDFFTRLDATPTGAAELAEELGLDARATARVLDALVVIGLLTKEDGRYRTTESAASLSATHPETIRPMVLHMAHMWQNWGRLTDAVRLGHNPQRVRASDRGGDTLRNFIGAMHVIGRALSRQVAAAYDTTRFRRLLDIGGGSGTYTTAFLERNTELEAVLFDLPDVVATARKRFEEEGYSDRARVVGGDFYEDELPGGCDLALLSAIIHQNSPAQNVELFRKIRRALVAGGVLLIRDHIMDEDRVHPPAGAIFALNMLVGTDGGDTYTFTEIEKMLRDAGFDAVRLARTSENMDGLVEAAKSAD